jgi:branched-chain amino acid transport system ATP-binding protein
MLAKETHEVLSLIGLQDKAGEKAGVLAAGDRKRLELGIVLATQPDLLLLDEPTCGMSPRETNDTIQLIREIAREKAVTVLFTEHKMDVVFSIASHITVMNFGTVLAAGRLETIRSNAEVQRIYFGEDRCSLR